MMSAAMPVIVAETFALRPGQARNWSEVGRAIRRAALSNAACLSFRLMRDRKDDTRAVLLSEWTDMQEFNQFVRESGLLWLERGASPSLTGTWSLLEPEYDEERSAAREPGLGAARKPITITGIELPKKKPESPIGS